MMMKVGGSQHLPCNPGRWNSLLLIVVERRQENEIYPGDLLSQSWGAWPFLVGGAICLVNSVNERDLSLLTSYAEPSLRS